MRGYLQKHRSKAAASPTAQSILAASLSSLEENSVLKESLLTAILTAYAQPWGGTVL